MEALSIASSLALAPAIDPATLDQPCPMLVGSRLHAALEVLLEARSYARDLDVDPWDFAVEIDALRELGLSNSDFRWLLGRGLIEHAVEKSPQGSGRKFERPNRFAPRNSSCFVITHQGAEAASRFAPRGKSVSGAANFQDFAAGRASVFHPTFSQHRPAWNCAQQELSLAGRVLLRLKIPAADAEMILALLEESAWPDAVEVPRSLVQQPERLERAIALLNGGQRPAQLRFSEMDGKRIHWQSTTALEKTS